MGSVEVLVSRGVSEGVLVPIIGLVFSVLVAEVVTLVLAVVVVISGTGICVIGVEVS